MPLACLLNASRPRCPLPSPTAVVTLRKNFCLRYKLEFEEMCCALIFLPPGGLAGRRCPEGADEECGRRTAIQYELRTYSHVQHRKRYKLRHLTNIAARIPHQSRYARQLLPGRSNVRERSKNGHSNRSLSLRTLVGTVAQPSASGKALGRPHATHVGPRRSAFQYRTKINATS